MAKKSCKWADNTPLMCIGWCWVLDEGYVGDVREIRDKRKRGIWYEREGGEGEERGKIRRGWRLKRDE